MYVDSNATYGLLPKVRELLKSSADISYLNGSSIHAEGQQVRAEIDASREEIYRWSGLRESDYQVVFTSGATESIASAFFHPFHPNDGPDCSGNLVTSSVEHSAVRDTAERLSSWGVNVRYVRPSTDGELSKDDVLQQIDGETRLLSLIWANNESGIIHPVPEIFRIP